jgi:hypothetical protein
MSTLRVLICVPGEPLHEKRIPHSLEAMQALVGGLIEMVPGPRPGTDLVVNEEGLLRKLAPNLALQRAGHNLVGPAFVTRIDREGACVDLTDEDVRFYTKLLAGTGVN